MSAATVQDLIDGFATTNVGVVVGIIDEEHPYDGSTPYLLRRGNLVSSADDKTPVPLDGATPFNIGSVTKTFTATLQANRQQDLPPANWGLFGDYMRESGITVPPSVGAVTLQQMATYQSGFKADNISGEWWKGWPLDTVQDLLDLFQNYPGQLPQCTPGECYSYSNFAWGLLGLANLSALSRIAPATDVLAVWADAVENLLSGLGLAMPGTVPFEVANLGGKLPAGFDGSGRLLPPGTNYTPAPPLLAPAGDLTSTGNDMYQWLAFHMGCTGGDPGLRALMLGTSYHVSETCGSPAPATTGIGWFFPPVAAGDQPYAAKDGGVIGFTSYMAFQRPANGSATSSAGVFVLTNTPAGGGAKGLGVQIIRSLLGNSSPGAEPPAGSIPPPAA